MIRTCKRFIVELLCMPPIGYLIGAYYRDKIPHQDCVILTRSPNIAANVKARLRWGFYERSEMHLLGPHLRADLEVIELGSSLGVISAHIARRLPPDKRLICVEANPQMIPLIEANLRENAHDRSWKVLNYAIDYNESKESVSFILNSDNVASHVASGTESNSRESHLIDVPTTQLKDLLSLYDVKDYVLFCDIEGAEADIFAYDSEAMEGCKQIIIELHQSQIKGEVLTPDDLADRLQTHHGFFMIARRNDVAVFSR